MGKIFYLMGKSASGKDSIYKKLISDSDLSLKGVVMYTTRPMREGEVDGRDYFFIDNEELDRLRGEGKVIEERTYNTMHGPWTYATIDDGQIDLSKGSYLIVGVLSSYIETCHFFGKEAIVPVYVEVEDGERLFRALKRERAGNGKYKELCRRFLADSEDFSEDKLLGAGIEKKYDNIDFDACIRQIKDDIRKNDL